MKKDFKNLKESIQVKDNKIDELESKVKSLERITKDLNNIEVIEEAVNKKVSHLEIKIGNLGDKYGTLKANLEQRTTVCEVNGTNVRDLGKSLHQSVTQKSNTSKPIPESCIKSDVFKCRYCGDLVGSQRDLSCHIKTFHQTNRECKQCDKKFPTSFQLESHLKEHGTIKKYQCQECNKTFHFKWRLQSHMKIHDDECYLRKCHFFNNNKQCPFEEVGCKFLHKESMYCKYKDKCKYDRCQFRH